jgi:hypothetical protein
MTKKAPRQRKNSTKARAKTQDKRFRQIFYNNLILKY